MLLVRANHPDDAPPPDDLAVRADALYRCSYLHNFFIIRPRFASRGETSTRTRSPTSNRTKFRDGPPGACAITSWCPSSSTRYSAYSSCSLTMPSYRAAAGAEPLPPSASLRVSASPLPLRLVTCAWPALVPCGRPCAWSGSSGRHPSRRPCARNVPTGSHLASPRSSRQVALSRLHDRD